MRLMPGLYTLMLLQLHRLVERECVRVCGFASTIAAAAAVWRQRWCMCTCAWVCIMGGNPSVVQALCSKQLQLLGEKDWSCAMGFCLLTPSPTGSTWLLRMPLFLPDVRGVTLRRTAFGGGAGDSPLSLTHPYGLCLTSRRNAS